MVFKRLIICTLISLTLHPYNIQALTSNQEFCYSHPECDPSTWEGACKIGSRQSPVAFTVDPNTTFTASLYPIVFSSNYYLTQRHFYIQDNGHTAQVHLEKSETYSKESPFFTEGSKSYVLAQIHLHWGSDVDGNGFGSEHSLNTVRYPMEIHMVHYSNEFKNLSHALEAGLEDAVTVLGIFVEIGPHNKALDAIDLGVLELLRRPSLGDVVDVDVPINLQDLLPIDNNWEVFRYEGSLTTPPCTEKVRWIVFRQPISITAKEFHDFNTLPDTFGDYLNNNFRPLQPLTGRQVQYQYLRSSSFSTSSNNLPLVNWIRIFVTILFVKNYLFDGHVK